MATNTYWDPRAFQIGYQGQGAPDTNSMFNWTQPAVTPPAGVASGAGGQYQPGFLDRMAGWTDPKTGIDHGGWGGQALGVGSALFNGWMGLQQLGMAKDSLDFQKKAFWTNYNAQRKDVNRQLNDRQTRRAAASPNAESVDSYMKRNKV